MTKFLFDVNVGIVTFQAIQKLGFDVKFVRDINPKMIDIDIIKLALSENRIIVTLDKDFGELVYNYKADHCGILLLRLDDASVVNKIKVLTEILQHHSDSLQNNFCVYQNGNLRIK